MVIFAVGSRVTITAKSNTYCGKNGTISLSSRKKNVDSKETKYNWYTIQLDGTDGGE